MVASATKTAGIVADATKKHETPKQFPMSAVSLSAAIGLLQRMRIGFRNENFSI